MIARTIMGPMEFDVGSNFKVEPTGYDGLDVKQKRIRHILVSGLINWKNKVS